MSLLILVSVIWAFSFGLIGSRLSGLDSTLVATLRLSLAWLCFLPFFRIHGLRTKDIVNLAGIGALQFGVMYVAYIKAFSYLPSHLVALFSITTPIYIVIAANILKARWRAQAFLCALLSVLGAGVIRFSQPTDSFWAGFALMQVANIAFGLGQVLYRNWRIKYPNFKDSSLIAIPYAGGAVFAGAVFLVFGDFQSFSPSLEQTLAILYLGIVASGLGFFWWNKGATRVKAGTLAAANNAVVPLAVAASLFAFGEFEAIKPEAVARLAIGAALIVASLIWARKAEA